MFVAAFLTFATGAKSHKLDLTFALQAYYSAMHLAESGEQIRLGVATEAFLDRNNIQLMEPWNTATFRPNKSDTQRTNGAYGMTAFLGHLARGRTVNSGDEACNNCKKGSGNFAECVTANGPDGELFSGACTNCAFPNRYRTCSHYNGQALGPSRAPVATSSATQAPRRRQDVQVVIPVPHRRVASASATPESVADSMGNMALGSPSRATPTPSTPGHSRGHSVPVVNSPVASLGNGTPRRATVAELQAMSPLQQANYILENIGGWRESSSTAPAWSSGNMRVNFEMLVNPVYVAERRLVLIDAIHAQDHEIFRDRTVGPRDFVTLTSYGQAALGANSIRAHVLLFLWGEYTNQWRARRNRRYSSETEE